MAGSESQNTVDKVQKLYTSESDHGTQKAYEALKTDYDNYAKTHDATATKQYWDDVTSKLNKADILPNLAVAWGQANRDNKGDTGKPLVARDGQYERFDLATSGDRSSLSELDKTMSQQLLKQFDALKAVHSDSEGGFIGIGTHEKDKITQGDLDDKIKQIDQARSDRLKTERETAENKSNLGKLLGTTDGNPDHTLFNKLDSMPGGSKDGYINKGDLDRYMKDYDYRKQTGQFDGLTADQKKKVDDEAANVKYLKDNWDKPEIQRLRDGGSGITADSLAKAGGFKDIKEGVAQNKVVPEVTDKKQEVQQQPGATDAKFDKDKATAMVDAIAFDKPLLSKLVTTEDGKNYIKPEQLNKVLDDDKAHGGKDLTAAQRDSLTYLKDNFKTLAPDGKFAMYDIPKTAFGDNAAKDGVAHMKALADESKGLVDGVNKLGGVEKLGKDGVISKADLDDKLAKATDKTTDEYKTLSTLRKDFDLISHDGKTINKDELKAFSDKIPGGGGGGGDQAAVEAKAAKLKQQIVTEATQAGGEGPYQAATRLLPNGSPSEVAALTKLLKKSYQDMNNDHTDTLAKLPVGYNWLNEKNMQDILSKSPALAHRMEELGKAKAEAAPPDESQRPAKKLKVDQPQRRNRDVIYVRNDETEDDPAIDRTTTV